MGPQPAPSAAGSRPSPTRPLARQPRSPLASRRGGFFVGSRGAGEPGAVEAEEPGGRWKQRSRGQKRPAPGFHRRSFIAPFGRRASPLPPRARQLPCSRAGSLRPIVHARSHPAAVHLARQPLPRLPRLPVPPSCPLPLRDTPPGPTPRLARLLLPQ